MGYFVYEEEAFALTYPLDGPRVTLGSSQKNAIVLSGLGIAEHHLRVEREGSGLRAIPLGSDAHPTRLNDAPLTSAQPLEDGDRLTLGRLVLRYVDAPHQGVDTLFCKSYVDLKESPLSRADRSDPAQRLARLYQITNAIETVAEPDEVFGQLAAVIDAEFSPSRLLIAELKPDSERLVVRAHRTAAGVAERRAQFSTSMMNTLRHGDPLIVQDALVEAPFSERPSVLSQQIRSAMGVPIRDGDAVIGVIYVDDLGRSARFSPNDLRFLLALSQLAALAFTSLTRTRTLERSNEIFRQELIGDGLLGDSPPMRELREQIAHFARVARAPVLIMGETGSGKERVARALHETSPRRDGPFVTVNCAAIPEQLIESELFGHEKGAFTGATKSHRGKFELADGGTLFLDEIADMSLASQARVLRAIELGEVSRVGSEKTQHVDCWIISASHKNLHDLANSGEFRYDLYYRLNVLELAVAPLRERRDDIGLLAEHFHRRACREIGQTPSGFSPPVLEALRSHRWPGNVRELRNEVERATILCAGAEIELVHLSSRILQTPGRGEPPDGLAFAERYARLDEFECQIIRDVLEKTAGNVARAAEVLQISRSKLNTRIDRFRLQPLIDGLRGVE
ncbi:MAG: sigma 54-interacting transcriptional regulator [Myxococcales bacterium]|nr:sigma 54-interacting transcriptional regulator [Myxococcales bacterium]